MTPKDSHYLDIQLEQSHLASRNTKIFINTFKMHIVVALAVFKLNAKIVINTKHSIIPSNDQHLCNAIEYRMDKEMCMLQGQTYQ